MGEIGGIDLRREVWLVTDPKPNSGMADVVSDATTLGAFMRMVVGGLSERERPAIHLTAESALRDASRRCWRSSDRLQKLAGEIDERLGALPPQKDE